MARARNVKREYVVFCFPPNTRTELQPNFDLTMF